MNGPINLENVLALEDELLEHDVEANAFVSKTQTVQLYVVFVMKILKKAITIVHLIH